jgi:hypothetical protein
MSVTEISQRHDSISVTRRRYPVGERGAGACEGCGHGHFTDFIDYGEPGLLGSTYHVPPRQGRRFCSNACRQRAYRERKKPA